MSQGSLDGSGVPSRGRCLAPAHCRKLPMGPGADVQMPRRRPYNARDRSNVRSLLGPTAPPVGRAAVVTSTGPRTQEDPP